MKKAFRIASGRYYNDNDFNEHIRFVQENIDCIDEVAIFVEYCHHAYISINELKKRIEIIDKRMRIYRKIGVKSVGINILNTIGQTDEAWDVMEAAPFRTMIGHDGRASTGCLCPTTNEFKQYISEKYKMLSVINPDFIWLDDDIRMKNHGVQYPCFCDNCIDLFNKEHDYNFSRETLVEALNRENVYSVRKNWVIHNYNMINNVIQLCETIIHQTNPTIKTGLMTSGEEEHPYSIHNAGEMLANLKAEKARPGGGFYNDDAPVWMLTKIVSVGRQVSSYSKNINDIQYEFENYPYQMLSKSLKISEFEVAASLLSGCSGIVFNTGYDNRELMGLIRQKKKKWETIEKKSSRKSNKGVFVLYNNLYDTRKKVNGDFFDDSNPWLVFEAADNLMEIGIAMTGNVSDACAMVLCERMSEGYSDQELLRLLSNNLFIDGRCAENLIERGFGKYIGVEINTKIDNGVAEVFTDHTMNGSDGGFRREYALTFFDRNDRMRCMSYAFDESADAQVLCNLFTIKGDKLGASLVLFENELGGKIVVSGYAAFRFLRTEEKRRQILEIFDWLSNMKNPVKIFAPLKVMPIVRESDKGIIVFLGNCNLDETGNFGFEVRTNKRMNVYEIDDNGMLMDVPSQNTENGILIKAGNITAWGYRVFLLEVDENEISV